MITIRPLEARDIEAARRLFAQLTGYEMTPDEMRDRLDFVTASPIDWLYVADVDGEARGLLAFRLRECVERPRRYGEIAALVTDSEARRQGIGRALVAYAEQLARDHECAGTWLVSGFGRKDEAHRFYSDLGYATTGYRFVKMFE